MKKIISNHLTYPIVRINYLLIILVMVCNIHAQTNPVPVRGDYGFAPYSCSWPPFTRLWGDSTDHVDTDFLVQRLIELKANNYFWLIGRTNNDWDDLSVFLPKAKMAGITVWVYLLAPSEQPPTPGATSFSEPYRTNYTTWAQEIARLSLRYSNLKGYVIDDFWFNVRDDTLFTPTYINSMVTAGKSFNPNLKFYPLTYSNEVFNPYTRNLSTLFDGLVVAFADDSLEITKDISLMNSSLHSKAVMSISHYTITSGGDYGKVSQTVNVTADTDTSLTFRVWAGSSGELETGRIPGYHKLQLIIDSTPIWSADIHDVQDTTITVNLGDVLKGRSTALLTLGIQEASGVWNYPTEIAFFDLIPHGINLNTDFGSGSWIMRSKGPVATQTISANEERKLPIILMEAADTYTYPKFYPDPPTIENRLRRINTVYGFVTRKQVEGMVIYCLDKTPGSTIFNALKNIYSSFWEN